ncbi:GTPase-activating protein and VPS9 domain-containing protein 1-like isoform X2 [Corticium candelabrum]|uniref:GTPase-activating protein and VPS9 domain-containing protein 1-like isoform X2 n=1 Tax=Corticium candelabrum TaxID=121492 RepID=UPI002E26EC0A|nr:GTPase-activating protein and VPS9 domain-containing protein 1-like isoform X2 [Corticium candelabrum]
MGELLDYVLSKPSVLAEMLTVCEREGIDVKGISGVIIYALFARSVTSDDEKTMTEVLHRLMLLQVKSCQNLRWFFSGNAQAFTYLFRTWCEGLLSAKAYLKASLQLPVMEIVRDADDSGWLEYDPDKTLQLMSDVDRDAFHNGSEQEKATVLDKIQNKVGVATSRLASFCIIILQSLHEQLDVFPNSIRWLAAEFKAALIESKELTEESIHCLLSDMIFTCFICPILNDPQKHGIATELVITNAAKHNLLRISQILRDLAIINEKQRAENLHQVHLSMDLDNWRSFLADLTTGVGETVSSPLLSSLGFQKTAVLATERELRILVNVLWHSHKSVYMHGLVTEPKMIDKLLRKIPSAYKPLHSPVTPPTTEVHLKPISHSEGSASLPASPSGQNSLYGLQPSPQSLQHGDNFMKHKRFHTSDTQEPRSFRVATISGTRGSFTVGDMAGTRRHTYNAAMLHRKQSVLVAADVLVVPLKTDCFTGQNATRIELKSEQQVLHGRTVSSVSVCSSTASTVNTRSSSGSRPTESEKHQGRPTSEEIRRSASFSVLPRSDDVNSSLFDAVHTAAGDTLLAKGNPFLATMPLSSTDRPCSLPLNLNLNVGEHSHNSDVKTHSLVTDEDVQVEITESNLEAFESLGSETGQGVGNQQQVGNSKMSNIPILTMDPPQGTAYPHDKVVDNFVVISSAQSNKSEQTKQKNVVMSDLLGNFDPIHSNQVAGSSQQTETVEFLVGSNEDPSQQQTVQPPCQLDGNSDIHDMLAGSGTGGLVDPSGNEKANSIDNVTIEPMPTLQGPERGRQGLLKKVSGTSASLSTSPVVSPRASPHSSPSSSPALLRKQKGKKLSRSDDTTSSVTSSTKSSVDDLILLSPDQSVIKEEDEDITLKYERKMQEQRRQQQELSSSVNLDVDDESCSDLGDSDDPLVAFTDAKRYLRNLFGSFDQWPLVGQTRSGYCERFEETGKPSELLEILHDSRDLESSGNHSKFYKCNVKWLLQLWLAEASEDEDGVRTASVKEALRSLDLLSLEKQVELLECMEHDYYQRWSYISYLTRTKQSLLRAIAMMERQLKRIGLYKQICWSNFTTMRVKALFEQQKQYLDSFAMKFENTQLTDEKSDLLDEFFQDIQSYMESDEAFSGISEKQKEHSLEVAERLCFSKVYSQAFYPNGEADFQKDTIMYDLIQQLSKKFSLSHVHAVYRKCAPWKDAQDALLAIGAHRSPRDKLHCIRKCTSCIMNTLHVSCSGRVPAADDFFPVMVYVIIKANPPHLPSTIQYLHNFQERHMSGELSYWWTQFCMAVEYIKTMKSPSH